MSNSNLFLSIGKPIKNEYGRVIGKVASFALTPNGKFDAVYVEFGDGQFSKQPMESLRFNGAEITFISKIKNSSRRTLRPHTLNLAQRRSPKRPCGKEKNHS